MPDDLLDSRLVPLANDVGTFTMVALDQRESLREMFPPDEAGELVGDATLSAFKAEAIRMLSPGASGMLLDHPLGIPRAERPDGLAPACGLLLAADHLHSVRGEGVVGSCLDPAVTPEFVRASGAAGLKYLVIWRRGDTGHRRELDALLALAERTGLPTFVEGIVRPPINADWRGAEDRWDAIAEAAVELSRWADVYKAEVPGYGPADLSKVRARSVELTAAITVPWVVLSNGVVHADFAEAVAESTAGGAHGFLAGRAIWADTVREPDPLAALASRSADRLATLAGIVRSARRQAREQQDGERA